MLVIDLAENRHFSYKPSTTLTRFIGNNVKGLPKQAFGFLFGKETR